MIAPTIRPKITEIKLTPPKKFSFKLQVNDFFALICLHNYQKDAQEIKNL